MARGRGGAERKSWSSRFAVLGVQVAIAVAFIAAWQFLPEIHSLRSKSHVFDPFFVSSPTKVAKRCWDLATGHNGSVFIWPYIWKTIESSLLGVLIGVVFGSALGLLLSATDLLSRVLKPFITAMNAVPRIALIPVLVVLFGPTQKASIAISVLIVFFVAFFAAQVGGTSVAPELLNNVKVLGATKPQMMLRVRMRFAGAWVMNSLPLAIGFSFLSVVTAEILTGTEGMGRLISLASVSADAATTFGIVVYLAVVGSALVSVADLWKRRVLHWWSQ